MEAAGMICRLALLWVLLFISSSALAAFGTPTSIAAANGSSGTTLTATVSATSGNLLVAMIEEVGNTYASGTLSDTVNGSWTRITGVALNNNANSNGGLSAFYLSSTATLTSTTLTYTKGTNNDRVVMSVFQVSGQSASPLDTAVTATAFGSSLLPSVTGGAPAVANELIVGAVGWNGSDTFAQDSVNGSYVNPPNIATSSGGANPNAEGGYIVYSGTSARTYAPTLVGTGAVWANIMVGFKASVSASSFIFTPTIVP